MSTKTTAPKISEESRIKVEEFKTTQQLYNEFDNYLRSSHDTNYRAKQRLAKQIGEIGEDYEDYTDLSEKQQEIKYKEYAGKVETIIKLSGNKNGKLEDLNNSTYRQIDSIYRKVLFESKRGFWGKLFDFFID